VKVNFNLPVPPEARNLPVVLPIDTLGGPWGTVPELLFEKKGLIPALQQLLVSNPKPKMAKPVIEVKFDNPIKRGLDLNPSYERDLKMT
jgi:hypothetical protein